MVNLTASQNLKMFLMNSAGIITNVILDITF